MILYFGGAELPHRVYHQSVNILLSHYSFSAHTSENLSYQLSVGFVRVEL